MNAENRTERRILLLFLGVVFLLHLACFFHVRANRHVLFTFDSWEYLQAADNLRTHGILYAGDLSEPVTPNPDYARDLNSSEIWAQKKGRSSLI